MTEHGSPSAGREQAGYVQAPRAFAARPPPRLLAPPALHLLAPQARLVILLEVFFRETSLPGAWVLELDRKEDERGFFARTYCDRELAEHGLITAWPQCNLSRNTRQGTLRGMHYNLAPHREAKLVR